MKHQIYGLFVCALLLAVMPLSAPQALPHGIPDLCASEPSRTVVASGTTQTLTGDHACIEVRGTATMSNFTPSKRRVISHE